MADEVTEIHPHEAHDKLNDHIYNISRKCDKILNREPVEDHAAILGLLQVTTQRRMHEHQAEQQRRQAAEQAAQQTKARFGVQ